jgi:glucokinase
LNRAGNGKEEGKTMSVSIGIDMGGTRIKIGLVKDGSLMAIHKVKASAHVSLSERLAGIANEIDIMLREHNETPNGIGIAFPGIVDSDRKKILSKYVKYPDTQQTDLVAWAEENWNVPLALENDARAALVGEWQYGAGQHCDNLVLIMLGTGVGTAALVNGRLLKGKHYHAGNLGGHMTINLNGDICNCGNLGCVESEASTWSLQRYKTHPQFSTSALSAHAELDFDAVFQCAAAGDALAVSIRENSLKAWSLGIINLILAYDPERVVIGGGIMRSKDIIIPHVKKMMSHDSWINHNVVELAVAEQTEYAGILGMAHLLTLKTIL